MIDRKKLFDMYYHMNINTILELKLDFWDLLYLLKLSFKSCHNSYISSIISRICDFKNMDSQKMDLITEYHSYLSNADIRLLAESFSSDIVKRDTLDYLLSLIDKKQNFYKDDINLLLVFVLSSVINSQIRKYMFEKYLDISDANVFSSYIGSIKKPEMMEKEFLKYKNRFKKYKLDSCIAGLRTDELRFNFFNKYYRKQNREDITSFICYNLKTDEYIVLAIDRYADSLTDAELINCINAIKSNKLSVDYIEKYCSRISKHFECYDFSTIYRKFTDTESIVRLVELLAKNKSNRIFDVIIRLKDENLMLQLVEKYFDLLDSNALWTILCHFSVDNKKYFANKCKDYLPDFAFERFITFNFFDREYIFKNFIDKMSPESFRFLFDSDLYYDKKERTLMEMLDYLLSFTNNPTTVLNIYNGFALNEPEIFEDLIYDYFSAFTIEERQAIEKLKSENNDLFSSFIFQLVKIPYLRENYYFLKKLSMFQEVSIQVSQIYLNYPKRFQLLIKLFSQIFEYDINTDTLISSVVDYFDEPLNVYLDTIDLTNITNEDIELLIYKIIKDKKLNSSSGVFLDNEYSNLDVKIDSIDTFNNYQKIIENNVEEAKKNVVSLEQYKNIILFDLYGMNLSDATEFVDTYCESLNKLDYIYPIKYIFDINRIVQSNDFDELSYYYTNFEPLSFKERYLLEYKLRKYFMKDISDSLYKVNKKDISSYVTYNGKTIPIYKPKNYFFLVHSLRAYGGKYDDVDDYFEYWNNNPFTRNHGICCSFISNQNIGQTAPVNDVIFGFDDFDNNAIYNASNKDICSFSDSYSIHASTDRLRFMLPIDYINKTRHPHNEFVLERKELRKSVSTYDNIQPSYIIVYSSFDETKLNNSYKAAVDLEVPIVYVDTYENALRENKKIEKFKDRVDRTYDITSLKQFLLRYENNYYGYYYIDHSMISNFFSKSEFRNYINNLLNEVYNNTLIGIIDLNQALDFYNGFLRILDECSKYVPSLNEVKPVAYKTLISKTKKYINSLSMTNNESQRKRY